MVSACSEDNDRTTAQSACFNGLLGLASSVGWILPGHPELISPLSTMDRSNSSQSVRSRTSETKTFFDLDIAFTGSFAPIPNRKIKAIRKEVRSGMATTDAAGTTMYCDCAPPSDRLGITAAITLCPT
jgi:hypothetical protein